MWSRAPDSLASIQNGTPQTSEGYDFTSVHRVDKNLRNTEELNVGPENCASDSDASATTLMPNDARITSWGIMGSWPRQPSPKRFADCGGFICHVWCLRKLLEALVWFGSTKTTKRYAHEISYSICKLNTVRTQNGGI